MAAKPASKASRIQRIFTIVMAGGLAAVVPLHAQQTELIPSGPLLNCAPSNSRWLVEFKYADESSKRPSKKQRRSPRTKTIVATRYGSVTFEEITDEVGKITEKWFSNSEQYTRKQGSPDFYTAGKNDIGNANYEYFSPTGFRGFDWISKETFVGIQKVLGHDCLVFSSQQDEQALWDPDAVALIQGMRTSRAAGDEARPSLAKVCVTACIDVENRLPVALRIVGDTRIFTFLAPPEKPVTLPPELVKQLEKRQNLWNQLVRAAPGP